MAIVVKIYDPSGTEYDVTNYVDASSLGTLNLRFEDEACNFVADDLQLTFVNTDGYFSTLWSLPLDPTLKFNEATGKGAWCLKITKSGSLRFEGDLDTTSLSFDVKTKKVETTWLGASKRAEIPAYSLVRVTQVPLYFTNERHKRKLSFYTDESHTTPKAVSDLHLEIGDIIKTSQLQLNGNVVDQDLTIIHTPADMGSLETNQVKVRQGCKKVYTQGICSNPFYKTTSSHTLTVAECVTLCFNAIGVNSSDQVITGDGTALQVDEFDVFDKTIADCLTDLAQYSGCVWFRETTTGKWYFIDRNSVKGSVKDITSLLCEVNINSNSQDWYDNVKITGTPPHFAPNSEPRFYRYGAGQAKTYEIETKYTSSLAVLETIAQHIYSRICKIRKQATFVVVDDGTAYNILDRVSYNDENYFVVEVSEDVRAGEYKGTITLTALSESGVTPDASEWQKNLYADQDPPYPPVEAELSSAKPSKRKEWWDDFRAIYPADELPRLRIEKLSKEFGDTEIDYYEQKYMLWAVRWKMEFAEDDPPDGFEISLYKENQTPDNPEHLKRHKGLRNPLPDANGYYYSYFYKPITDEPVVWYCVVRTWDAIRGLSAYSDEASTDDDNDPNEPPTIINPAYYLALCGTLSQRKPYLITYDPQNETWGYIDISSKITTAGDTYYNTLIKALWVQNNRLYIYVRKDSSSGQIYYSNDGGQTWAEILNVSGKTLFWGTCGYFLGQKGIYSYFFSTDYHLLELNTSTNILQLVGESYPRSVLFQGIIYVGSMKNKDEYQEVLMWAGNKYDSNGSVRELCVAYPATLRKYKIIRGWITGDDVSGYVLHCSSGYSITDDDVGSPFGYTSAPESEPNNAQCGIIIDTSGNVRASQTWGSEGSPIYFWVWQGIKSYNSYPDENYGADEVKFLFLRSGRIICYASYQCQNIYYSDDMGVSWSSTTALPTVENLRSLVEDANTDNVIWGISDAESSASGYWRGVINGDNSITWTEITESTHQIQVGKPLIDNNDEGLAIACYFQSGTLKLKYYENSALTIKTCDLTTPDLSLLQSIGDSYTSFAVLNTTTIPTPPNPQNQNPIYLLCRNLTSGATEKRRIYRTRDRGNSFDKIWGDADDFVDNPPYACIQAEHANDDFTRIYRADNGHTAKYSDSDFIWYDFFSQNTGGRNIMLAYFSKRAYLCDGYNVWQTLDRTAPTITWQRIFDYIGTADTKIEHIAIDPETDLLYALSRSGKVYQYSVSNGVFGTGYSTGFGNDEAVGIVVTKNKVIVYGNNASYKLRIASKSSLATWTTLSAPSGLGTLEEWGLFVDPASAGDQIALLMTRNATAGVWATASIEGTPNWQNIYSGEARCACSIADLENTYMVAGNNLVMIVAYVSGVWTVQMPVGIGDLLSDKTLNFICIATPRTYEPSV